MDALKLDTQNIDLKPRMHVHVPNGEGSPTEQKNERSVELFDANHSPWMLKQYKVRIEKISYKHLVQWYLEQHKTLHIDFHLRKKTLYLFNIQRPISSELLQILENGGFQESMSSSDNSYERKMADSAYKTHTACFYLQNKESIKMFLLTTGQEEAIIQELYQS